MTSKIAKSAVCSLSILSSVVEIAIILSIVSILVSLSLMSTYNVSDLINKSFLLIFISVFTYVVIIRNIWKNLEKNNFIVKEDFDQRNSFSRLFKEHAVQAAIDPIITSVNRNFIDSDENNG